MPVDLRPGQVVVSADGHRLGLIDERERGDSGEGAGIVVRRDERLRGRLTRIAIAWVAGMAADGVYLAVGRSEVSAHGSIIRTEERRAARGRRQIDREGAGRSRVHPNRLRRRTEEA